MSKNQNSDPTTAKKKAVRKKKNEQEFPVNSTGDKTKGEEVQIALSDAEGSFARSTKGKWLKRAGIAIGAVAFVCLSVYCGGAYYFSGHFFPRTEVNAVDVSGKTAAFVHNRMERVVADYRLTIVEKDGKTDEIAGTDLDISYSPDDSVSKLIKSQNTWTWPSSLFGKRSHTINIGVRYSEEKLKNRISGLKAVTAQQTEPVSAFPKFDGNQFVIEPEVYGTAIDTEKVTAVLKEAINGFAARVDLLEKGCYKMPKFIKDSPEVSAAVEKMNHYTKASITYTMTQNEVVDKNNISQWLSVDENMNVVFNEDKVKEWLAALGDKYDTQGATRTITTPAGKTAEVSGGTYGWSIDEKTEYNNLIANIENGDVVTKEPAYYNGGTAAAHAPQDWGSTYVEVDLSAQHMWYIVNGGVQLETDVVTGRPGMDTPPGVYSILEKQSPSVLVGEIVPSTGEPEYRTKVNYWIRVTWSGIGFHDANWQSAFGGSRYVNGFGSHGCINMPPDQAASLYSALPVGTPVIIHY